MTFPGPYQFRWNKPDGPHEATIRLRAGGQWVADFQIAPWRGAMKIEGVEAARRRRGRQADHDLAVRGKTSRLRAATYDPKRYR